MGPFKEQKLTNGELAIVVGAVAWPSVMAASIISAGNVDSGALSTDTVFGISTQTPPAVVREAPVVQKKEPLDQIDRLRSENWADRHGVRYSYGAPSTMSGTFPDMGQAYF